MAGQAIRLANELVAHLKSLERTRTKMEELLTERAIVRRDIEQVYKGLYLDAITSLEELIENLFIGLLVGRLVSGISGVVPRVSFKSDRVAREVVFGGQNYVDWLPYYHTQQRAKAFFRNGLPFTSLEKADTNQLERLLYVRNAIAHKSRHSQKIFERKVIQHIPLTPREKTPAGYLRSIYRGAPVQTRYEELVTEMVAIARKLCQ